jgi:predicted enzyme related to lactoylglutathione lyase
MANPRGRFVWYELMTRDLAAARTFYGSVVGWQAIDGQMPGMDYWMFTEGDTPVTGLMNLPDEARNMGTPPSWIGYIAVDDVDASTSMVTANGGRVYRPAADIPNVGRFAIVADPQGAAFALFKSANPEQVQPQDMTEKGRVGWHELYAVDQASVFDFYGRLFGWKKQESMDMGEMGVYQIFGVADEAEVGLRGNMLGGMMNKPPMLPGAAWGYYFNVGNIDEAAERVKSAGGQIVMGPQDVPGGGFILGCIDPQGAGFSLMGSR